MAPHRGHKFDAERTSEPPYISEPLAVQAERWRVWVRDLRTPATEQLTPAQLDREFGAYAQTYDYEAAAAARAERRRQQQLASGSWSRHHACWRALVYNAWLPLLMRFSMLVLSAVTIDFGARLAVANKPIKPNEPIKPNDESCLDQNRNHINDPVCRVSPILALVLASLAIPYLLYIAYDEYFGGPVGVRSPFSKARLLFFDLFFVVIYSVNVTLAGDEALTPCCRADAHQERTAFALIVLTLVAWIGAFSITLIRLIARIGGNYSTTTARRRTNATRQAGKM